MTDLETEALAIIQKAFDAAETYEARIILNVFRAHWALTLRADQIKTVGDCLNNVVMHEDSFKRELSKLVRNKVLRTRTINKKRVYELKLS